MRHCISCLGLIGMILCLMVAFTPKPLATMAGRETNPQSSMLSHEHEAIRLNINRSDASVRGLLPTIVIDPGHGGNDEGAKGFDLKEKDVVLDIALRVERLLQNHNLLSVLTRRSDVYVPLNDRAQIANQFNRSLFVSIHLNQSQESTASGVETYYAAQKIPPDYLISWVNLKLPPQFPVADTGKSLAASIQEAVTGKLPVANRGIKGGSLYVVCNVRNPAVLIECGFISNPLEAQQLKNEDYKERMAASIAAGIVNYQKAAEQSAPAAVSRLKF